jgi:integrase
MLSEKQSDSAGLSATLTIPELEQSKAVVLNSLASQHSRRSYEYTIERFIAWYCSEPRLTFKRSVVVKYRSFSRDSLRGSRDGAMLGLLLGCGLRRSEAVGLNLDQFQSRESRWVIVNLVGKGKRLRTVGSTTVTEMLRYGHCRHWQRRRHDHRGQLQPADPGGHARAGGGPERPVGDRGGARSSGHRHALSDDRPLPA